MADTPHESVLRLPLARVASAAPVAADLGTEVVELFDQLRTPLLRYLLGLGLPVQDGEEIVQEAFLALFQHLRRGGDRGNLRGWMFRVAHNLGLKRARNRRWVQAKEPILAADTAPNPEEHALDRQKQVNLQAVFRALPEQDRRCLALRAEGFRYREIAAVLEISLGSVAMSMARALARLTRVAER